MTLIPSGELVYGLQLPVQAQSTLFVEAWEKDAGADELAALARAADDANFFYVAVCDHVAIPRSLATAMGTTWYDTMTTLGFLAGITMRTRLMSHVAVLPYRHPLMTAKAIATLDTLSHGRAILGAGAGHAADEFATLGVDFAKRGALLDEAIDVVKAALLDEFPIADGPTWPVRDVGVAPRPVQQPRPPVWIGGSAPPSLHRAGEKGDGWLPQGTPRAQMPDQIATVLAHRERAGIAEPIEIGCITEILYVGEPSWDVGDKTLSGSPDFIAERLREFGAMGCSHMQVRFRFAFARRVRRPDVGVWLRSRATTEGGAGVSSRPGLLEGKVAIVSGLGPGMGRDISLQFAEEGADVVLAARTPKRMEKVEKEIIDKGGRCLCITCDITDNDACVALVAEASSEFGGVDVLVNNAFHGGDYTPFMDGNLDTWRETMDTNFFGTLQLTKAVVPSMRARGGGHIVMVNTMSVQRVQEGYGAYAGSKGALATVTKTLAVELGKDGIRVNAVHPGYIWGDSVEWYFGELAKQRDVTPQEIYDEIAGETALKYLPHSSEIAGAVLFYASDLSKCITGTALPVNGGHFMNQA